MDGLKLERWKENFVKEVKNIQIEFDAFLKTKDLKIIFNCTWMKVMNGALRSVISCPKKYKSVF